MSLVAVHDDARQGHDMEQEGDRGGLRKHRELTRRKEMQSWSSERAHRRRPVNAGGGGAPGCGELDSETDGVEGRHQQICDERKHSNRSRQRW